MPTDAAFWRDLETRFRELLTIPESARLKAMYVGSQWRIHLGPRDQKERARLMERFRPLARTGAIAAGVENTVEGWLDLLRTETPYFRAIDATRYKNGVWVRDVPQGGRIPNL